MTLFTTIYIIEFQFIIFNYLNYKCIHIVDRPTICSSIVCQINLLVNNKNSCDVLVGPEIEKLVNV